jgi:NAD(P)H-hydrate repair Nnr-like enzyme with NAD(P)H-hydrate dehydratase domain
MLPFDAARLGAHVHGAAADQWAKQRGCRGLRAIELADELSAAISDLK